GAFLSGGIDSSLVVANMAKLSDSPVKTNSIGFNETAFNELAYARETSRLFGSEHHEFTVDMACTDILDLLSWHYDEPFADSSALPTYYVSKMTRQNVTVALSGDGGDENFAGYRRYYFDLLENKMRAKLPRLLRKTAIAATAALYPKADWLPQWLRAKTLLSNLSLDSAEGYFNSMSHFLPAMRKRLFNDSSTKAIGDYTPYESFRKHFYNADTDDPLSRIQYVDIKTYLVDDILTKVDRASMANSLEVRVPLLDHEFVELAASIPSKYKLQGTTGKYLLKKAAAQVLPQSIINRKKMGFAIPVDDWFRGKLRGTFESEVLSKSNRSRAFFDMNYISRLWADHQRKTSNYGYQLWALLMFEKWAKKFL
ncbi:MAG: asparagine synthetase B, partial [Chitinivibrionales bacterium]|nr:asparagine synthetase B [Chitinivibrionales bacterium]MBD3356414.1 asparagine synthetase B [Chitinivibrionales bacterium]